MRSKTLISIAVAIAGAVALYGCSGNTSGEDENSAGTQYVADDSAGTIRVVVDEPELAVASTTGFTVEVRDANQAPVPGMTVACDSEAGVAILEPTTGQEITDSRGNISGKIGCRTPGSYQFACRLPIGGNKRQLVRIKCTGELPQGFDGFPGSAGGGLGTGGSDTGAGTTGSVRITSIAGSTVTGSSLEIDTERGVCGADPEPFTNDSVVFTVVNNTNSIVRLTQLVYEVPGGDVGGSTFVSDPITSICEVPGGGGSAQCSFLFVQASGSGRKYLHGSANPISFTGFKTITFRLRGTSEGGTGDVSVNARTGFSFANFNSCPTSS